MSFPEFVQTLLDNGADYSFDAGRAGFLGVPPGAPTKVSDEMENADNLQRSANLILDPSVEKPTPLCVLLYAGKDDLSKRENETYYFRITPDGSFNKAFVTREKLDDTGAPIKGSGIVTPKDIHSFEILKRLNHELNFWLKGMYRLTPKEIAARRMALMAAMDDEQLRTIVDTAVEEAPARPAGAASGIASDVDEPMYKKFDAPNNFAVVVGIEKYSDLPEARFAERDANAMHKHLLALGYPQRNIHLLLGDKATRSGIAKNIETWLAKNVGGNSTVFVFYSGHGASDVRSAQPYLMPFDSDPQHMADTSYPLKRLYSKLGALKAKCVIIVLDTCFSGAGGRSILPKGVKPLVLEMDAAPSNPKVIVLSASRFDQVSGTIEEQGHGTLTYFLLKGLNEEVTDANGNVTIKPLYNYLVPKVEDVARRENRGQTPQMLPPDATDVKLR